MTDQSVGYTLLHGAGEVPKAGERPDQSYA